MSGDVVKAKGGSYPMRRPDPPPMAYFDLARPAPGLEAFGLDLSGLRLEIEGLDAPLARSLRERYGPYGDDGEEKAGALRARVGLDVRAYFVEPPESPEFNPVGIACDGDRIRFVGYRLAGWFAIEGQSGGIALAAGEYEPKIRAFENFIRTAVAWRAAARGGALVHAASAVRNGNAYLFYGESGAGKSTLSASTSRATIVSDDLSLVLPGEDGRLELVGSPFRGTYEGGAPVIGRFPVAAAFRIVKSPRAAVVPVARAIAFGQLVGNLTFVAEAFSKRPDLFASVERAFTDVPLAHLEFRRDDSDWDAIDAAGM